MKAFAVQVTVIFAFQYFLKVGGLSMDIPAWWGATVMFGIYGGVASWVTQP